MSTAEAEATEFDAATKDHGDKIVGLTLLEAKKVVDYLKEVHNIEPAGGGAVMMAAAGGDDGPADAAEQTEFSVVLLAMAGIRFRSSRLFAQRLVLA